MERDFARAVYVISVAAELAGMHPQTLRIYERKGLVDPARTTGGSRRYSEHDIALLRRIQDLTNAGVNLEGVRRILDLEAEVSDLQADLAQTRADVDVLRHQMADEIEALRRQAAADVEQTHRQYRRDLVPVRNLPDLFAPKRPPQRRPHGA